MADWKKVVVSGSVVSQLENDAGYIASVGGGILSSSAEGTSQGQLELNGVDVDINGLGTADTPTFAGVTASLQGNVVGNVTGDVTGDVTGTVTGDVTGSVQGNVTGDLTGNVTGDVTGNVTGDLTGTADTASNVAFDDVVNLTAVSTSFDTRIAELETGTYELGFEGDSGTGVILNSETLDIAGGSNITTTANTNELSIALDSDISLTSVTASVEGDVVGNLTGDVTGNVTGDLTGNADTATALATARNIGGTSFDGTADITPDNANTASYVAVGDIDGDITAVTASLALAAESLQPGATGTDLTLTGDLTVQGTTTTIETANLNVEDQFINLNDGGAAADGGIVVEGAGTSFGWDNSAGRWAFDYSGATEDQTTIGADAYAAAVVTSDDANYQKNGNIRVTGGDIFIYVE